MKHILILTILISALVGIFVAFGVFLHYASYECRSVTLFDREGAIDKARAEKACESLSLALIKNLRFYSIAE